MDASAYLERIEYRGSIEPTVATLNTLIERHQHSVPFENIDIVRLHRPIVLDSARHFQKIVGGRRGGFCYELNGLMAWLLETLGYEVSLGYARWPNAEGVWGPPFDHIVLVATVPAEAESLLVDVGFGADSPVVAIPLIDGQEIAVAQGGVTAYRAVRLPQPPHGWRIESKERDGDWSLIYEADLTPRSIGDFAKRCAYLQTAPDSHFTQNLICSLPLENGRVTIGGGRFIMTTDGNRTERPLAGMEDELELLREWFAIDLDPERYGVER